MTTTSAPALSRTVLAVLLLVFLAVLVRTAWISDDAMISLRTVLNVTHGFGLTFNIAERVQTYTHPLWLLLLAGIYLPIGNVYLATFVLSMGTSLLVFWLVIRRAVSPVQAWLAVILLLGSRAFVDFSTSGLENPLSNLLLVVFLGVFLDERLSRRTRLTFLWGLASLAYLARPDTVLLVLPLLGVACVRAWGTVPVVRSAAVGSLPAVAWTLFALVYYGFPFPNTAYAKLGTGISQAQLWNQGLLYVVDAVDRDPLTLVAVGVAILFGCIGRSVAGRALAGGIGLYLAYIVSIGGDFMAGRFFAVPLLAAVLLISQVATATRQVWLVTTGVLLVVGLSSAEIPLLSDSRHLEASPKHAGIIDERAFYFRNQSLVYAGRDSFKAHFWYATTPVGTRDTTVHETCGGMGAVGLEVGPQGHLLDVCALADPLLARLPSVFNEGWRIGHFARMIPAGYKESLAKRTNLLADPQLREFYDQLNLVTRAPRLFSVARLRAIVGLNTGAHAHLVNGPYYRFNGALVTLDDVSHVMRDGTPADAPGNRIVTRLLAIRCEDRIGRRYVDVTVDSDDKYRLTFVKANRSVAFVDLGPVPEHRRQPGLVTYTTDVPAAAVVKGFDTIVISPWEGDGRYAVGHLLLERFAKTDAELYKRVAVRDGLAAPVAREAR